MFLKLKLVTAWLVQPRTHVRRILFPLAFGFTAWLLYSWLINIFVHPPSWYCSPPGAPGDWCGHKYDSRVYGGLGVETFYQHGIDSNWYRRDQKDLSISANTKVQLSRVLKVYGFYYCHYCLTHAELKHYLGGKADMAFLPHMGIYCSCLCVVDMYHVLTFCVKFWGRKVSQHCIMCDNCLEHVSKWHTYTHCSTDKF